MLRFIIRVTIVTQETASQQTFICSKSIIGTLEKVKKYVQT